MFKVGDKVVVSEDNSLPKSFFGLTGTIVLVSLIYDKTFLYGVSLDNPPQKLMNDYLHTLSGFLEDRTGYWFREERLKLFGEKGLKPVDLKGFEELYV